MADLRTGLRVDRYRLHSLEPDGHPPTWRVEHLPLGSWHRLEIHVNESALERSKALEAWRRLATLHHSRLARVLDILDIDGHVGVVTEAIEGPSLGRLLDNARPTAHAAALIARGLAEGLVWAHDHGLVHGALTSKHVLLSPAPGGHIPVLVGFVGAGHPSDDLRALADLLEALAPSLDTEAAEALARAGRLARSPDTCAQDVLRALDAGLPGSGELLAPGAIIGNYRVDGLLGQGGTADVYRVEHVKLDSWHALKVPRVGLERGLAEGKVLSRLVHPHIVGVTDLVQVGERPGLVMELVDGQTLRERMARGPMRPDEVDSIAEMVLRGVAHAHRAGWIHRDLKPENVLLCSQPSGVVAKVADFGVAKWVGAARAHTRTGDLIGTPGYMAPEQIRDARSADERSDVFSLGCLLFELVTGRAAFPGDNALEVLAAVAHGSPPSLHGITPSRIRRALKAALHPDRSQRPTDAGALLALWRAPLGGGRQHGPTRSPTRWLASAVAAIGVAAPLVADAPEGVPLASEWSPMEPLPESVASPVPPQPTQTQIRARRARVPLPEPEPEPFGRVTVLGDLVEAHLSNGAERVAPGVVPPGPWTLEASFGGEPAMPVLSFDVTADREHVVRCEASLRVCR